MRYARDASGAVESRDDAVGTATYQRDDLGRIVQETDGLGRTLSYGYDDRGNLARVGYPDGSEARYGYDAADNLVSVAAPEGEYRYSYDAADRPVSLSRPNGASTEWSYDADGNVSRVETTGASGALLSRYAYSYDAEGRLSSCEASGTEGAFSEAYSYDAAGNRARLVRTGDGADDIRYSYDADDRLVREVSAAHGTTTYEYDAAGQLVSKRADGEGETAYDYGVEGRLLAVSQGGRALMAAAYDGDGRRIMQASPYHEQVEGSDGTGMGDAVASEGDEGEEGLSLWSLGLFWYGFAAGLAGALAAPNPAVMARAVKGVCALVEATWPEGAFDPDAADYALSHLKLPAFDLAAMTGGYGIGEPGHTDELLDVVTYTGSSVIGSVSQVAFSHSTRSGDSIEAYGLERLSKDGTSYAYDGRGSVAQMLTSAGSVSSWHMWGTFGEQEAGTSPGELPSYGYNAEEAHPQTGLQYLRARYYDASTGRFGVQDSYLGDLADPLSLNRYLYCLADPLNLIDPTGYAKMQLRPLKVNGEYPRISLDVPTGRWNISDEEARLTTKAGIANWIYSRAVATGASSEVVNAARQAAERRKAELQAYYCGSASKIGYDRQAARNYMEKYAKGMEGDAVMEGVLAWIFGVGRNPDYPSFKSNCANFVSQVLAAGGIPQNKDWFAYEDVHFDWTSGKLMQWVFSPTWSVASSQFEYFSDPSNGYINGSVIDTMSRTL